MVIDIERLKVDESLWPDGATHYCEQSGKFGMVAEAMRCCCIPRPKPAAEWVDGLPPVGCECEGFINYGASTKWRKCEVLKHNNGEAAVHAENRFLAWCKEFRPIRTQAEIGQEEAVEAAKVVFDSVSDKFTPTNNASLDALFSALYDANLLRKPAEEVGRDGLVKVMQSVRVMGKEVNANDIADALLSTCNVTKKGD